MTAPARSSRRCPCGKAALPGDAYCNECQTVPGEDRCPVTELLRAQCAHCRPVDPENGLPLGHRQGYGRPFRARYPGRCADCREPFAEGDEITPRTDGSGYVCEGCAP